MKFLKIINITCISIGYLFITFCIIGAFCYKPYDDLGDGYRYFNEKPVAIYGNDIFLNHILNHNHDDKYIIVKQNLFGRSGDQTEGYDYDTKFGNYYWIIDKSHKTILGPMRLEQYKLVRDSLKITLQFEGKSENIATPLEIGQHWNANY